MPEQAILVLEDVNEAIYRLDRTNTRATDPANPAINRAGIDDLNGLHADR